jgi:hypothetical protein
VDERDLVNAVAMLAYFSHSYRWQQKELNHFIWRQLSSSFYFTVDPPDANRQPMQIPHLETMMLRSRCFIAVIARRDDLGPELCSPYQLFENSLAIRARRPRLLIVSKDIDRALLGPAPEQIVRFEQYDEPDSLKWFQRGENKARLPDTLGRFVDDLRSTRFPDYDESGPIGLAFQVGGDYPERSLLEDFLQREFAKPTKWLDLSGRSNEAQFLRDVGECAQIVQEVRATMGTALDIQGLLHAYFRPTIRICRLGDGETAEQMASSMHLSRNRNAWSKPRLDLPLLYTGYQVGNEMQPVIFWREPKELFEAIKGSILGIRFRRKDLDDEKIAARYFLGLGRVPGKVFISNEKTINPFSDHLRRSLDEEGVECFHYTDRQAKGSEPDFPDALRRRIGEAAVFVALLTGAYTKSRWCMSELKAAVERSNEGRLIVVPYLLEQKAVPPDLISYLDAPQMYDCVDASQYGSAVDEIVKAVLEKLESNHRLLFATDEEELLLNLRARFDVQAWQYKARDFMDQEGVVAAEISSVFGNFAKDRAESEHSWSRLADLARRSYRAANALGLLLLWLAAESRTFDDEGPNLEKAVIELAQRHRLTPDVRSMLGPSNVSPEVGLKCVSTEAVYGVFEGIRDLEIVNRKDVSAPIDDGLFAALVNVGATAESWQKVIVDVSSSLKKVSVMAEVVKRVDELTSADILQLRANIGFCMLGDERGLQIPFEWIRRDSSSAPICLEQPVRRFLTGFSTSRTTLRTMLLGEQPRPLRALIVGSDAGGVPQVEIEAATVAQRLSERFQQLRWPAGLKNIKVLTGSIDLDSLEKEISFGGYDLLHIAAHGAVEADEPGLLMKSKDPGFISAQQVGSWVRRSELRFAYLSCCRRASPDAGRGGYQIRQFDNLIQAFVKEAVPEVVGFLWPIGDLESSQFADMFYSSFRRDFRAATALLGARRNFRTLERIWAAPVLYSQSDTKYI